MKKISLITSLAFLGTVCGGVLVSANETNVAANKLDSKTHIEFKVKDVDPNNPAKPGPEDKPEMPGGDKDGNELPTKPEGGNTPETSAPLMLNFVPNFEFGSHEIKLGDQNYFALNEIMTTDKKPISHFIQVTDLRGGNKGWHVTLDTSPLSNGKSVLNESKSIIKDKQVLTNLQDITGPQSPLKEIEFGKAGQSIMSAPSGTGSGRWWTIFGKEVMQTGPKNESVQLVIPAKDGLKLVDGHYNAVLTWNVAGNTEISKAATPTI